MKEGVRVLMFVLSVIEFWRVLIKGIESVLKFLRIGQEPLWVNFRNFLNKTPLNPCLHNEL